MLIHLAWGGLPNYRSLHHVETELPAQYRFLRGLVEAGLQSLVVAGTCFEYGMQSGPLDEEQPTRPETPYGFAKDTLRRELQGLVPVEPQGGKVARAAAVSHQVEGGNVWLPARSIAPDGTPALDPWVRDLVEEAAAFPTGVNDDQVDAMTQALIRMARPASTGRIPIARISTDYRQAVAR